MNVSSSRLPSALCLAALCALVASACGHVNTPPAARATASAPATARPAPSAQPRDRAPSRVEVARAIRSLVARRDPTFPVAAVANVELARTARDRWWVCADAIPPAGKGLQTPTVVAVELGGRWRLAGYGTDLMAQAARRQMRMPAAVARQLFPGTGLWAGYIVAGSGLRSVSATWVEPSSTVTGKRFRSASFWVGLGGWNGAGLSQVGSSADTQGGDQAAFYAYPWYELYPKPPVTDLWARVAVGRAQMDIAPGDTLSASVVYLGGGRFRLTLIDRNLGERFSTVQRRPDAAFSTAEIIVEGYWHGGRDELAAFRPVRFTSCRVNGRPLGAWRPAKSEIMRDPLGRRYLTRTSQISGGGTSFSVTRQ